MKYIKYYYFCMLFTTLFSQDVFEGYTLFTPGGGGGGGSATTYLLDNDQDIIQSWNHSNGPASMPYLIPGDEPGWENTLLIYPYRVNSPTMESGGVGGAVQCLTWEGELVWEYILSNSDYQHHHDVEPLPNGNVLLIAWEKKTSTEAYAAGRQTIDNPLNQMWSSALFEIQPDGNGSAEVVWEWHLWDHLIQDADPGDDNYGVVADHPELFDINNGTVGATVPMANGDWIHLNAIDYHEQWDQIAISSRYQSEIFVIDHGTTTQEAADHTGGNYGKGGDFLYRWGNPQNYDRGSGEDQITRDQHSINWIPYNSPGENNFILFNNYHEGSGVWGEAAVLEMILPVDENGNYSIQVGEPYGPVNYSWSYEDESDIFTAMQGGSFRLPNGNTLITDCDSARIIEVTSDGQIVWEYIESGNNVAIARAQKYPLDYFDGEDESILGDINEDGILNILDIVSLVNLVLLGDYVQSGDINQDGFLNILDIVSLVNVILNT